MLPSPGRLVALAVFATAIPLATGLASVGVAGAQDTTTTSTAAPTTTTLPSTTTTAPATTTTTTLPPTSTTTTTAHPTTTSHPTSTTTTLATATSSNTRTWAWVLLALAVALVAIGVVLLIVRTRRQGREANWEHTMLPSLAAAELARDLALSQTPDDDEQRHAAVAVQVDEAVNALERGATSATDETHAALCVRAAESLRGLAFAIEADRLMRSGGQHPTGEQLAAADMARRNRATELDAALDHLKRALTPKK